MTPTLRYIKEGLWNFFVLYILIEQVSLYHSTYFKNLQPLKEYQKLKREVPKSSKKKVFAAIYPIFIIANVRNNLPDY